MKRLAGDLAGWLRRGLLIQLSKSVREPATQTNCVFNSCTTVPNAPSHTTSDLAGSAHQRRKGGTVTFGVEYGENPGLDNEDPMCKRALGKAKPISFEAVRNQ